MVGTRYVCTDRGESLLLSCVRFCFVDMDSQSIDRFLFFTMASRDLTSAFIERRTASNRRRKSSGPSSPSKIKPFGELL
jgi:hypothetical protein